MNFRPLRVANLIQEELGKIILREIDTDGALLTVTGVEVEKKLEHANVKVSVLPKSEAERTIGALQGRAGELQHLLLKKINIKPMPRIRFLLDRGAENAATVEKILLDEDNRNTAE